MIFIIQPVFADAGFVSISYRGSGGYYIGDTITFDGKNTAGNTTIIKITGPEPPPGGGPALRSQWDSRFGEYCPGNREYLMEI